MAEGPPPSLMTSAKATLALPYFRYVQEEAKAKRELVNPDTIYTSEHHIHEYVRAPKVDPETTKPSLFSYMNPLLGTIPYAPSKCVENDRCCVEKRVTSIQHKKPLEVTRFMVRMQTALIKKIVPDPHKLELVEPHEVYAKQARPQQQRTLEEAELSGPFVKRTVKAFTKAEAYAGPKDPRNISTIAAADKLPYSCVMYAVAAHLKQFKWYSFGKQPVEIANNVASIAELADVINEGDFSRMDGRVSNVGRTFTEGLLARLFSPKAAEEALRTAKTQYNLKGVTAFAVAYWTLFTRLSGSPETSTFNTLENLLCMFVGAFLWLKDRHPH